MTDAQLAEIEARCNAATKGPWTQDRANYILGPGDSPLQFKAVAALNMRSDDFTADADFIIAARSDVPALVAEVRRLRAAAGVSVLSQDAPKETK